MKDIDFDELDKAVNSLMATTPTPTAPVADAPAPAPTSPEPQPPAPAATPVTVTVAPRPAVTSPTKPAIAPKNGRFMDMVQKTSAIKPRPASPAPSREGLVIAPRTDASITSPESQPDVSTAATLDTMPDPINGPTPPVAVPTVPAQGPADQYESPFLADAKVDKRPLNPGATSSGPSVDLEAELNASETPVPNENGNDEPPAVPEVPELNSDLIAIESNETVPEPEATQAVDTAEAAASVPAAAPPLGSASIPQQYTAKASSGDQSHAAIYDASQYPEPVTHPAKKKSGWLWVLWVALLLGVGAGGAVLLYTLGIIP